MATASDTPVLDTLAAMTIDSVERCGTDKRTPVLTRTAALVAMETPAISYLAHIDPEIKADLTGEQPQDILVATALAEAEAEAMANAEARSRNKS